MAETQDPFDPGQGQASDDILVKLCGVAEASCSVSVDPDLDAIEVRIVGAFSDASLLLGKTAALDLGLRLIGTVIRSRKSELEGLS
jgi:hypothetical protein